MKKEFELAKEHLMQIAQLAKGGKAKPKTCENCKFEQIPKNWQPCLNCVNRYQNHWKPKGKRER